MPESSIITGMPTRHISFLEKVEMEFRGHWMCNRSQMFSFWFRFTDDNIQIVDFRGELAPCVFLSSTSSLLHHIVSWRSSLTFPLCCQDPAECASPVMKKPPVSQNFSSPLICSTARCLSEMRGDVWCFQNVLWTFSYPWETAIWIQQAPYFLLYYEFGSWIFEPQQIELLCNHSELIKSHLIDLSCYKNS